ncbi:hypothetical protein H0E84_03560 [Luteimonas sp. SJ-92]|uniref:Uncharacterized protein n=1 Tax=Luteimonas salinisoli TaxID=2752307 RepID=A0A853J9U7_9GAMM|nr:hypothetical protein [Luteimonas salinisoli]NZA25449.1 hypothetical protein [Luteimonas salinisoli]
MKLQNRLLAAWVGVLTVVVGAVVLTGASSARSEKFDVIDVQRINVREPDGTLRMTVSNMAQFPGLILEGEQYPHDRKVAGMLFFNDEGTENGGLVYAGSRGADGEVSHFVHLSMDQYQQDQVVTLNNIEAGGRRRSGLTVGDRPERPILEDIQERATLEAMPEAERAALMERRAAENYYGANRMFAGRNGDRESVIDLMDEAGKTRLRLRVEPDGAASIEFLDEDGEVTGTVTPETLKG